MINIKDIVNDKEWQDIRGSMVGTWKHQPEENVKRLRSYLGPVNDYQHPKFRRVYNYLTGSGFRIGVISHPHIDKFLGELRDIRKKK